MGRKVVIVQQHLVQRRFLNLLLTFGKNALVSIMVNLRQFTCPHTVSFSSLQTPICVYNILSRRLTKNPSSSTQVMLGNANKLHVLDEGFSLVKATGLKRLVSFQCYFCANTNDVATTFGSIPFYSSSVWMSCSAEVPFVRLCI